MYLSSCESNAEKGPGSFVPRLVQTKRKQSRHEKIAAEPSVADQSMVTPSSALGIPNAHADTHHAHLSAASESSSTKSGYPSRPLVTPFIVPYPEHGTVFRTVHVAKDLLNLAALTSRPFASRISWRVKNNLAEARCDAGVWRPFYARVERPIEAICAKRIQDLFDAVKALEVLETQFINGFKAFMALSEGKRQKFSKDPDWKTLIPVSPRRKADKEAQAYMHGMLQCWQAQQANVDFERHPGIQRIINHEKTRPWTWEVVYHAVCSNEHYRADDRDH